MYKGITENVEVYFICYKKEEMNLIETYYDKVLDIHYWYFNGYRAYKEWKTNFQNIEAGELAKMLLTVAASRYLIYKLENAEYENQKEYKMIIKDLKKIEPQLEKIIKENEILSNL